MTTSAPAAPASASESTQSNDLTSLPTFDGNSAPASYTEPQYDYSDSNDDESDDGPTEPNAPSTPGAAAKSGSAPAADAMPEDLVAEAAAYGLDKAHFPNAQALRAAVTAFDKQVATWGRAAITGEGQPGATSTGQQPATPPAAQAKVTEVISPPSKPSRFDFSKIVDNFDPELVNVLKSIDEFHEQQRTALEQRFQSVEERYRQADEAATEQRLDAFFDGLGEEYATIFGKGAGRALNPESAELKERGKVLEAADLLCAGYASRGQQPPSEDVLLKKALQLVHGDKADQLATKRITSQVRDRQGQFTARPTQQPPKPVGGDTEAIRKIASKMKALGYGDGSIADEPEDNSDSRY